MTTELRRSVKRKTVAPFDHHGRRLIVQLEPGDVISIREERTRKWFTISIGMAYRHAVKMTVDAQKAEKKKSRMAKRGILK